MTNCPCGSGKIYKECCGPYLAADAIAPTAESLMRSRYTAFAKGNVDYLVNTHHPKNRSANERIQLRQTIKSTTWLGLTVLDTRKGLTQDKEGVVEFVAFYRPKPQASTMLMAPPKSSPNGQVSQMHERSRFVRDGDRWLYVDGDQLPPLVPKRNDPCWCRSGKKFKHCHGK